MQKNFVSLKLVKGRNNLTQMTHVKQQISKRPRNSQFT